MGETIRTAPGADAGDNYVHIVGDILDRRELRINIPRALCGVVVLIGEPKSPGVPTCPECKALNR
jgi:hypothetical protein